MTYSLDRFCRDVVIIGIVGIVGLIGYAVYNESNYRKNIRDERNLEQKTEEKEGLHNKNLYNPK